MSANLKNSAVATGLEKVTFHFNPKEGQCQRMFKLQYTIALISHASKVMFKILQARLHQCVHCELPDVQVGFRKGKGTREQIANIRWIIKKAAELKKKKSTSASFTMPMPLTVWIATNCAKFFKMRIPDHLTCLLRNLYAGQEATVRTVHRMTDSYQIGKGVRQGCILSPCLFNLYAEYIMQNAWLD